ncbi:12087_t:CDS:2 [Dentiscutata erythropus]|uniref:12087_t:CDS:1 n=1 Tax=Dentiscutata erythropus TaxID=1348616 RepID=A0A9N8ZLD3_9GLOM|nr:12087_t:CDS:2 [Dentiscutata erythropus]
MKAFKRASTTYKAKYEMLIQNNNTKTQTTKFYDTSNEFEIANLEVLGVLQYDAKDNGADYQNYIAEFVSNEGSVLRRMECKKEGSQKLYELVGGRILDLRRGQEFESIHYFAK